MGRAWQTMLLLQLGPAVRVIHRQPDERPLLPAGVTDLFYAERAVARVPAKPHASRP